LQRAADRKLETPYFLVNRYYLALLDGDEAGMKREIDRARGNLETEGWMSHHHALEDMAKAKNAHQDFLTLWNDADADIPVLRQARAEYAKLSSIDE
jgi:hypothetical protein